MNLASAEYVKLSYQYPDHELVADTIMRLGGYFRVQATKLYNEAKSMIDKDKFKSDELFSQSKKQFSTAGSVFEKLLIRFPGHPNAVKASVVAGTCFMFAGELDRSVVSLQSAVAEKAGEPGTLAEAYYWLGDAYLRMTEDGYSGAVLAKDAVTRKLSCPSRR